MLHVEQPLMCNHGMCNGWTHVTNIQVIKHVGLMYEQVHAMYDSFTQPIEQAQK